VTLFINRNQANIDNDLLLFTVAVIFPDVKILSGNPFGTDANGQIQSSEERSFAGVVGTNQKRNRR
jgi:hypothetical protein